MAAFRTLGKFREDIKTALTGAANLDVSPTLELTSARIILGFNSRLSSGDTNLAKDIRVNGPLAVIGPISQAARDVRGAGAVRCSISIFIEKDKKADFDALDVDDLLEDAINRLLTESNYTTNSKLIPGRVALVGMDYEASAHPGTLVLSLEVESIPEV